MTARSRLITWFDGLWMPPAGPQPAGEQAATGRLGERAAAWHLLWRGHRLLAANVMMAHGEIDLVTEHQGMCVFVEVKTRRATEDGTLERDPAEAVNAAKRSRMRAAARQFLDLYEPVTFPHRFDVVAVRVEASGRARVLHHRRAIMPALTAPE